MFPSTNPTKPAVVLLSGGLDSATTAAIAVAEGYAVHALSIDYGQRHRFELESAGRVAEALKVASHQVLSIDLAALGGSALTADLEVPQGRSDEAMARGIPVTYVPARNTIMLSMALGYAEVLGAADLFIGVNAIDYSGYPDCRPEFLQAFEHVANLATKAGVEGTLALSHSCAADRNDQGRNHSPGNRVGRRLPLDPHLLCAQRRGSFLWPLRRLPTAPQGFAAAGLVDPIPYQHFTEDVGNYK